MKFKKPLWGASLVVLTAFSAVPNAVASTEPTVRAAADSASESVTEESMQELISYVDSLPEDVVREKNDRDLASYIASHAPKEYFPPVTTYNAWECAGAITLIIAGTIVPISKAVKIAKLVRGLGGASKVGKAISEAGGIRKIVATKGASIKAESMKNGVLSLAAELTGIGTAQEKC